VALVILALVLLKVLRVFVDGIVRKMHIKVSKIASYRWHVLRGCKTSKSFLIDKNSQRSYTGY
jgi:hypothetical protein